MRRAFDLFTAPGPLRTHAPAWASLEFAAALALAALGRPAWALLVAGHAALFVAVVIGVQHLDERSAR